MRILVDVRHLTQPNQSGVGKYTTELLRALFEIDKTNSYTLLSTGRERPVFSFLKTVHSPIPNKLLKLSWLICGRPYLTSLAKTKPNLIFLPNLNFSPLPDNVPYVLTVHDLSWKIFPECYSWKMRAWHALMQPERLIKNATAVICPSQATKDDLVHIFHKDENAVHVIPHGVDATFTSKQQASDHGVRSRLKLPKRYVLFVGTLEPRKNILTLIDAMEEYRKLYDDDIHLVLAGAIGWKSSALQKRIASATYNLQPTSCPKWIHQLGYVKDSDRPTLFRMAECLIWPSLYEGFGLPVLEAMASGTPVITSHTSSLPELTGGAAIHIDPYNHRDIVAAMHELFSSNSLRQRLVKGGLERAQAFTWNRCAEQTRALFERIL